MKWLVLVIGKISGWGRYFEWTLVFLACSVFVWYSQHSYFADSEIFSMTISRTAPGMDIGQAYKLIFSIILKGIETFNLKGANQYLLARFIFASIGILNLFLAASVYKMIFRRPHIELAPVIFILGFSFFFERGFRVRADNLATTWHLLIVWYFFKFWLGPSVRTVPGGLQVIALTLLELLLVATSVKAIFILVCLHVMYFVSIQGFSNDLRPGLRRAVFRKLHFQLDLALIATVVIYKLEIGVDIFEVLFGSLTYLQEATHESQGMPEYLSTGSFFHVKWFLTENPVWVGLIYFPIVVNFAKLIKLWLLRQPWASRANSLHLFSFILMVSFLLFPEKYPFLLASLLPIISLVGVRFGLKLCLWISVTLKPWLKSGRQRYVFGRLCFLGVCLIAMAVSVRTVVERSSNREQVAFINKMTNYFDQFGQVDYYDVIGTIPNHRAHLAFAGPNQAKQNRESFFSVVAAQPSFIFYTRKMQYLEPHITGFLHRRYLNLGQGVFVRGVRLWQDNPTEQGEVREWMGEQFRSFEISLIDSRVASLKVPFLETPEYWDPLFVEPMVNRVPLHFYMVEQSGAIFPLRELLVEDANGWISLYDDTMKWRSTRKKFVKILIPISARELGVSLFPPLDFQVSDSLMYLFAFDPAF